MAKVPFREALAQVWAEPQARRFAVFVLISMMAYSAQDLILEPFAGLVFGFTPGESTKLSGVQHGVVLAGMVLVAVAASVIVLREPFGGRRIAAAVILAAGIALLALGR